jgi:hypothetical protein
MSIAFREVELINAETQPSGSQSSTAAGCKSRRLTQ